jgi:hypothetical protein
MFESKGVCAEHQTTCASSQVKRRETAVEHRSKELDASQKEASPAAALCAAMQASQAALLGCRQPD